MHEGKIRDMLANSRRAIKFEFLRSLQKLSAEQLALQMFGFEGDEYLCVSIGH